MYADERWTEWTTLLISLVFTETKKPMNIQPDWFASIFDWKSAQKMTKKDKWRLEASRFTKESNMMMNLSTFYSTCIVVSKNPLLEWKER